MFPVSTGSPSTLHLFVFTQVRTQSRFLLLLELLWTCPPCFKRGFAVAFSAIALVPTARSVCAMVALGFGSEPQRVARTAALAIGANADLIGGETGLPQASGEGGVWT